MECRENGLGRVALAEDSEVETFVARKGLIGDDFDGQEQVRFPHPSLSLLRLHPDALCFQPSY